MYELPGLGKGDQGGNEDGGVEPSRPPGGGGRGSGGSAVSLRRSASYNRPWPIVYGTASVVGVPLCVIPAGDGWVQTGVGTNTRIMAKVAVAQVGFAQGPISSFLGVVYDKKYYDTAGTYLHPKHFSESTSASTWTYAPEFTVGNPATASTWSYYSSSPDANYRVPYGPIAIMRCYRMWIPSGGANLPEIVGVIKGKLATNARTDRYSGRTIYDAHPGDVLTDIIDNVLGYGAGTCVVTTGQDGTSASSYATYCTANGWYIATTLDGETSVADIVAEILTATNSIGYWSGGKFKVVPLGDTAIGSYTPVNTATGLTDDDFVMSGSDDQPVRVSRRDWLDTFNVYPIEYSADRATWDSELVTVESMETANVSRFAVRRASTVSLPCIRTEAHARAISGIMSRRSTLNRATFEFKLTPRYGAYLECGDLVSLTHSAMGLSSQLARLTSIDEDPDGLYSVSAEEWISGSTVTVSYVAQAASGFALESVVPADTYAVYGGKTANGNGSNLLYNGDFSAAGNLSSTLQAYSSASLPGWVFGYGGGTDPKVGVNFSTSTVIGGDTAIAASSQKGNTTLYMYLGAYVAGVDNFLVAMGTVSVMPGRRYIASTYTGASRCNARIFVTWKTSAGGYISTTVDTPDSQNDNQAAGGARLEDCRRIWVAAEAPATAAIADVYLVTWCPNASYQSGGTATSTAFYAKTMMEESRADGPGPWMPGQGTWTDGTAIKAATVTADRITTTTLSAISADLGTITAGSISGVSIKLVGGSYQFVQGAGFGSSSNLLQWYGLASVSAPGSCTRANAIWCMDTAGNVIGPLTASATPADLAGVRSSATTVTVKTSGATTVVPSGGRGGYTYSWAYLSGPDTMTVTASASATTYFQKSLAAATTASAVYRCTVTDADGKTATADVSIYLENAG